MTITYPVNIPTTIGMNQITLFADNVDALSESPFTYASQVIKHQGERWRASVVVAPCKKDKAEAWVAFLLSLGGRSGTFYMGDPNMTAAQGTVTSLTVTGSAFSGSVTATMTGTLVAGDYIQIGTGSDMTLHKVLVGRTNSGTLEIWPRLRKARSSVAATTVNTRGIFRLASPVSSWQISSVSTYGISFDCVESI